MPKIGNLWARKFHVHYLDPDDDSSAILVVDGVDSETHRVEHVRIDIGELASEGDRTGFANVVTAALQKIIDNR